MTGVVRFGARLTATGLGRLGEAIARTRIDPGADEPQHQGQRSERPADP